MSEQCAGANGLDCIGGWLYSSVKGNSMIFPANKKCPTCSADDRCVHDPTLLCDCWVRLANGVNCPLAPDVPNVIEAYPVASFQCPKCDMVMVRESNTYSCISPDCEQNGVKYKPVPWEMERVDE